MGRWGDGVVPLRTGGVVARCGSVRVGAVLRANACVHVPVCPCASVQVCLYAWCAYLRVRTCSCSSPSPAATTSFKVLVGLVGRLNDSPTKATANATDDVEITTKSRRKCLPALPPALPPALLSPALPPPPVVAGAALVLAFKVAFTSLSALC